MNSAPYNICKKAADHANSGSGGLGFSATSDAQGYISLSTCKETSTEIWSFKSELSTMHMYVSSK